MDPILKFIKTINSSKVFSVEKLKNKYSVNSKIYKAATEKSVYFVKILEQSRGLNECLGYRALKKYLPIPELIEFIEVKDKSLLIYSFYDEPLLTDLVVKSDLTKNSFPSILEIENNKNLYLRSLYLQNKKKLIAKRI